MGCRIIVFTESRRLAQTGARSTDCDAIVLFAKIKKVPTFRFQDSRFWPNLALQSSIKRHSPESSLPAKIARGVRLRSPPGASFKGQHFPCLGARAPVRESATEIKGRGRPTRSSAGRSIG
jgi:hypothetical protein